MSNRISIEFIMHRLNHKCVWLEFMSFISGPICQRRILYRNASIVLKLMLSSMNKKQSCVHWTHHTWYPLWRSTISFLSNSENRVDMYNMWYCVFVRSTCAFYIYIVYHFNYGFEIGQKQKQFHWTVCVFYIIKKGVIEVNTIDSSTRDEKETEIEKQYKTV